MLKSSLQCANRSAEAKSDELFHCSDMRSDAKSCAKLRQENSKSKLTCCLGLLDAIKA